MAFGSILHRSYIHEVQVFIHPVCILYNITTHTELTVVEVVPRDSSYGQSVLRRIPDLESSTEHVVPVDCKGKYAGRAVRLQPVALNTVGGSAQRHTGAGVA